MRRPNCECCICGKPLYRRSGELAKFRHVACMEHRGIAQARSGLTDSQRAALALGRVPGTNHRTGYVHREEPKRKASESHKAWCAANSDKVKARECSALWDLSNGMTVCRPCHYNIHGRNYAN